MTDAAEAAFVERAEAFLARHYTRKGTTDAPFEWGAGPDGFELFPEVDGAELEATRAWRRTLFDVGYAWITGPVEYGGAGLPHAYEASFDHVARSFDVPGNRPLMTSLGMVAPTVLAHGSEASKRRYLRALADVVGCQLQRAGSRVGSGVGVDAGPA